MNNYKNIIKSVIAAIALFGFNACTADLDQYPHTETTSKQVYTSVSNYSAVLGKIYNSLVLSGQGKGGDNSDLSSNFGFDYMRIYFNMQECGTDELASTWIYGGEKTDKLTFLSWDSSDPWISDMYYRIYYNITLCNEFLRNCSDDKMSSFSNEQRDTLIQYKSEVRFMRALFYYHALDLYRNIPFVDENDPVGGYIPPRYTAQESFDFIEGELKDIATTLLPANTCPYGRASQGAAYTLLAKLYLNAEVYIGQAKYSECIEACKNVINQGYSLNPSYAELFNADNDKRTNEIIFSLLVDATHTVSWGSTTYLVCGEISNSSATQVPADYGASSGWGMFRVRGDIPVKFTSGSSDSRYMFYTTGQTVSVDDITNQSNGYLVEKWTNLTDGNVAASNTDDGGVNTDFPLFRLADVYLMYAEAVVRGGTGGSRTDALTYLNMLRERAYGSNIGNIIESQMTKDYIINERARELYWECTRRTDLIRFNQFTTASYIWQWKGGTKEGKAVDDKFNIYPIPSTELTANPNLFNEKY